MHIKEIIKYYNATYPVKKLIINANYWQKNFKEVIWLIGDGRSGTTWVSDLINHDGNYREMFEPFHPSYIKAMNFLKFHQYIRPDASNKQLEEIASAVFTGKFTHPRVDYTNRSLRYTGLLIKDIYANLFSCWAAARFPEVKIILLIRNPFAVALSKYKQKDWFWAAEPMELLKQKELFDDYLHPHEGIIRETSNTNNFILSQILIWSIIHYVPFQQFQSDQLHIVFYEDIFLEPMDEVEKIFRFAKSDRNDLQIKIDEKIINRPSWVSGKKSNIVAKTSPLSLWKNEIPAETIDAGFRILQCFELEKLYDDNVVPNRDVINNLLAAKN